MNNKIKNLVARYCIFSQNLLILQKKTVQISKKIDSIDDLLFFFKSRKNFIKILNQINILIQNFSINNKSEQIFEELTLWEKKKYRFLIEFYYLDNIIISDIFQLKIAILSDIKNVSKNKNLLKMYYSKKRII